MLRLRFDELSLPCDRVARFGDGSLAVVSVGCGKREAAMLRSSLRRRGLRFRVAGLGYLWRGLEPDSSGYNIYSHKLSSRWWHVLALSKRPGFLPCVSHKGLWLALKKYDTPMRPEWIRWVGKELVERGYLKQINGHGVRPGVLEITGPELDEVVCYGVRQGLLDMPVPGV